MAFTLDPRLKADTIHAASLALCELLVMNDARYPWVILVPRVANARELHDLNAANRAVLVANIMAVSTALDAWEGVEKVNVGALGNIVSQLHVHIIGRYASDPAWPGPVWGHSARVPYRAGEVKPLSDYLLALRL